MTASKNKNIYPALILLLIGGFLLFSVWSAFQASGLGSKVADVDYYRKGLAYNTSQEEKRAAEVLGWNLETRLSGRYLELRLTDRAGSAISQANGTLYLAIPGAADNLDLPVREVAPGSYRVMLRDSLTGTIQAHLELARQGARLNRQLLLNLT